MMFKPEQLEALKAPLGSSHVKTRKQAGRELSYVEGWWAIAEANRIFGFDGWHRETMDIKRLGEPYEKTNDYGKTNWYVAFMAKVRITVGTIVREGCGYGSGIDKDLGSAHESALKEAETDAMKRALMTFGNPFGLALYDKEQNGVVDDAPKAEPKPVTAGPDPKQAAAVAWAEDAIPYIRKISDGKSFDAWHKENRERVARIKNYDPNLHQRLVDAVSAKLDAFNPIGV